jgi:Transposase DDE domain
MNYKLRTLKTKSGKYEVQVICYHRRKTIVANHLGTANDEGGAKHLVEDGKRWIQEQSETYGLWSSERDGGFLENYEYLGFKYFYACEFLEKILSKFKITKYFNNLFLDLVIARILEPQSKKGSLEFLEEFANRFHSLDSMYKQITQYDGTKKESVEKEIIAIAKSEFGFDFSFVLYDVTTLYFESFEEYEFQCPGFSKDHKANQPQVVVGLLVTKEGFPLSYQVWKGNTFEGHTFIPTLKAFKILHKIEKLTVVADSAMLSKINFNTLKEEGLNYIVGARLGNLKQEVLEKILKDFKSENGFSKKVGDLIVDFSYNRYLKDLSDLEKQKKRAEKYLGELSFRTPKLKYLKTELLNNTLNQELIDKHKKLLGLKGYYTDLNLSNAEIINYYHNLYKVEHAWRIAKSDLQTRPIYHHKGESIRNHLLICFVALSVSVYLEIKNQMSLAQIIDHLKSITDATIKNNLNGNVFYKRVKLSPLMEQIERVSYG